MSGIVGYISNTKMVQSTLLDDMSDDMSESTLHVESSRKDEWSNGFLAVSRVHHGVVNLEAQPIFNEDKTLLIVMAGEIFDYEDLKQSLIRRGHEFTFENNDAEYCLHLYEEWGEDAFKKLNGSFCIAIHNLKTAEFLLVNDRFSSYPLFYYLTTEKMLLFSTKLSPILQSPEVPRDLDLTSIFEFLTFQRVLGTKTFYKNLSLLRPAHILRYQDGKMSMNPYWEMRYKEDKQPEKYYVNKLAAVIKKSVERRTKGNYRFGLLLSGGLDSRMVLAASDKKMVCFTVGDFENREVRTAKRIAQAKGCEHVFLKRKLDHYASLVNKAVEAGDGMYSFEHAHNIGFFHEIRRKCEILLHGYALDSTLRGLYLPKRRLDFFGRKLVRFSLLNLSNRKLCDVFLKENSLLSKNPKQLLVSSLANTFDELVTQSIKNLLEEAREKTTNPYNSWDYCIFSNLFAKDFSFLYLMSNRTFIDTRTIAFDNDLLDFYLELPPELRFGGRVYRKALRKISPSLATIPLASTELPPITPMFLEWIFLTIKTTSLFKKVILNEEGSLLHPAHTQDSWPNFSELIRYEEGLKKLIGNTIRDPECLNPQIFNIRKIKEILEDHLGDKADYTNFLLLLFTFGRWHKKYGPKKK